MNVVWLEMRVPRINLFWREWLDSSAVQLSDSSIYPPLQPRLVIRKQAWTDVEGMFVWMFYLTKGKEKRKRVEKFIIWKRRGWIVPLHSRDPIFRALSPCLLSVIVTALAWETSYKSAERGKKRGRESSRQTETVARLQRKSIDFALLDEIDLQALPSVSVRPPVKAINSWCERAIKGTLHARDASVMGVWFQHLSHMDTRLRVTELFSNMEDRLLHIVMHWMLLRV